MDSVKLINKLRILLLPFSLIYGLIILIRNKLYDWEILKSYSFNFPIICVGNLAVGGSGKTPTTEYLIRLLEGYKIATLSRGYGRKTKGFLLAEGNSTAETIGDEPLQYFRKFKNITVAVSEDRVEGVKKLMASHDVIILDDAFQHRRLKAGLNMLLFEFFKLRRPQFFLPAGDLRDAFSSRTRADLILVTKTPLNILQDQRQRDKRALRIGEEQQVVHSFLKYRTLIHVFNSSQKSLEALAGADVYLLTGIANPKPLLKQIKILGGRVILHRYPDHHVFSFKEIEKLKADFLAGANEKKLIVTTEKDCQRLKTAVFENLLVDLPTYYIPMEVGIFDDDKDAFDRTILEYVESYTRNG